MKPVRFIRKGFHILQRRLRDQGMMTTAKWVYARGFTKVTGLPTLNFSRVTPQLYVGAQFNARGKRLLERSGIAYDVNMRGEFDDAAYGLALEHYCYLPTVDDEAPTPEHLMEGVRFIESAVQAGGKVYIHCAGGVGRAPTMAAAYLMSTGLSLDEAVKRIQRARPFITIMPPQREALLAFEQLMRQREAQDPR